MNCMGFHFCQEELMMLLIGLPFVGAYWQRLVLRVRILRERFREWRQQRRKEQ